MATRQDLLDHMRELINTAVKANETKLALGGEVNVSLSGELDKANGRQLEGLLDEVLPTLQGVTARVGWVGSRAEGDTVIIVKQA